MAHGYRTLERWNQWLTHDFLGKNLLSSEEHALLKLLNNHFGTHALLIGVPEQYELLKITHIPHQTLLSPLYCAKKNAYFIEGDFHELPIITGSADLVILPHTLELLDNPRQLLSEACRITKPEGLIIICGFNPYSLWGIAKIFTQHKTIPWRRNFIHSAHIKNWLELADFKIENYIPLLFNPPLSNPKLYKKFEFLESLAKIFPSFGGVYIILARAKVAPLTPIRLKWKQKLNGIRISTSIPGNIARQSK